MTLIVLEQNRGKMLNIVMANADGTVITPGVADFVRVRIGRAGQADVLSLTSGTPSAAGSTITAGATNVVRLDATDLNFTPGTYTLFVEYFDAADALEWKLVDEQVLRMRRTVVGIVELSELLLEMGLSDSVTDEELAVIETAQRKAAGAIKRFLHYDPTQMVRTEFYPRMNYNLGRAENIWEVTADTAYVRQAAEGATSELQIQHLPIRSTPAIDLRIDYGARAGTVAGSFAAASLQTEGTDFWPNYDKLDSDGNSVCSDGIMRSVGLWPSTAGAVRIVYTAGYSYAELHGEDDVIDASPILEALVEETKRRAEQIFVKMKSAVGFTAGPKSSESLGDYSYSIDTALAAKLYGSAKGLTDQSMMALESFVNMGISFG